MKLCRAFGEQGKNRETFAKPCLGAIPSWLSLATAKLHVTIGTSSLLSPLFDTCFQTTCPEADNSSSFTAFIKSSRLDGVVVNPQTSWARIQMSLYCKTFPISLKDRIIINLVQMVLPLLDILEIVINRG